MPEVINVDAVQLTVPDEAEEARVYYDAAAQQVDLAIIKRKPTLRWYHNPLLMLFLGGVLGVVVHAWLTGTLFA
jgi:hypothetical protein